MCRYQRVKALVIAYTHQAQIARAHLLRGSNALLIFVEDASCQNMHIRVLNRILGRRDAISQVFPLYGRKNVVEAALRDKGDDPKRVYLIDGDFDVLTGRVVGSSVRLCRLRAYSIENLLFSEDALVRIAEESSIDENLGSIRKKMAFETQWKQLIREFEQLFVHYAVVSHLDLPIVTVGFNVARLIEENSDHIVLTRSAVKKRICDLRTEIVGLVGWKTFREEVRRLRVASKLLADQSLYISGKDYLLPVVHAYLRKHFGLRDSFKGLTVRLAGYLEPDISPEFRDFVRNAEKQAFELIGASH